MKYIMLVLLLLSLVSAQNGTNETDNATQTNTNEVIEPQVVSKIMKLFTYGAKTLKGDLFKISAYVAGVDREPTMDAEVDFFIDDALVGKKFTNDVGLASVEYDTDQLTAGPHDIHIEHEGKSASDYFELEEIIPDITEKLPSGAYKTCDQVQEGYNQSYIVDTVKIICSDIWEIQDGQNVTIGKDCWDFVEAALKVRPAIRTKCQPGTKRIVVGDTSLEYEKLHLNCGILDDLIKCDPVCYELDGEMKCGDGDGDGVCESGETCTIYKISNNDISPLKVMNGNIIIWGGLQ